MAEQLLRNEFLISRDHLDKYNEVKTLLTKYDAQDVQAIPDFSNHSLTLRFSIIARNLPEFAEELAKSTKLTVKQKINGRA